MPTLASKLSLAAHVGRLPETLTLTPKQFGGRIGRSGRWVCERCRPAYRGRDRIRVAAGGPPYLIPISQLARFL